MSDDQRPLSEDVDLDAWEPQAPPADFAERVLGAVRTAPAGPARRRLRAPYLAGGVAAVAIAAAILLGVSAPPRAGEAIAKDRVEVGIGRRATAVLEPGASVKWNGDDVVQEHGDVFYRVEPGARFTVHTPAGDVEVKGTCFSVKVRDMQKRDLKVAAVSTALSALAFVAVYEGKVAVSHAGERVDLRAGETAQTGAGGVQKAGAIGDGDKALDQAVAEAESDDPQTRANKNLVRQVGEYRTRLEAITKEKGDVEQKLKKTESALSAAQDGAPVVLKHDFDLAADDWKELSKDGTIKFQMPCVDAKGSGWTPPAEKLDRLGLSPQDGPTLKGAYERSSQRVWSQIKPLCAAAVGSAEVASRIGPGTCVHLVLDIESERDEQAARRARREVGEIRAGVRPMPGPNEPMNPVMKLFLATTGASKALEDDLAQSFGPEEAHRLIYSNEMCMGSSVFGGSPSKKK